MPSGSSPWPALSSISRADCERQFVGRQFVGQARPALALLQERPVAADADENLRRLVAFARGLAERDAAHVAGVDLVDLVLQQLLQARMVVAEIERLQVVDDDSSRRG